MDKGANGGTEFIRADLSAAREAAAAQAMREAITNSLRLAITLAEERLAGAIEEPWSAKHDKCVAGQVLYQEAIEYIDRLRLPDTTALDRLIAERVREARMEALGEAAVITMGIERHMLTDDCGVMVPDRFDEGTSAAYEAIMGLVTHLEAARGSKEGRDG